MTYNVFSGTLNPTHFTSLEGGLSGFIQQTVAEDMHHECTRN